MVLGEEMKKGLVYYTDNNPDPYLLSVCRNNLVRCSDNYETVSVSHKPVELGKNIVVEGLKREPLSIFKQILRGLEENSADIIFLIEHDILYHPSHFDFTPPREDIFYYNRNRWAVDPGDGKAVFYQTNVLSLLVAYRKLLLKHFRRRVEITERDGWRSRHGYSPPKGLPKEEQGRYKTWMGEFPNLDIRHSKTYTRKRMHKSQFRSERSCRDWTESYDLPYWGNMQNWNDFLRKVNDGSININTSPK